MNRIDFPEYAYAGDDFKVPCAVGERLWVREACCIWGDAVYYRENEPGVTAGLGGFAKWRPSIHMPRWASRLTLTVESVKVERLLDISEADAIAEGCALTAEQFALNDELRQRPKPVHGDAWHLKSARGNFIETWCAIHGGIDSWDANPWVCAISFMIVKANIDALCEEVA
jgi:hypothetical protein